ncbi:5356_t:CDS:2 [Ambispora leptoticha]|uniref:5356_t:CDS:1 n=1 Tax=Ambispora leptoticha TaxID=144679 RepID=A0A9N9GMK0_9GLOM|nr:5356_t:CDS:2 [Ambispora leptoticha]
MRDDTDADETFEDLAMDSYDESFSFDEGSFDENENTLTLDAFFEITFGLSPLDFDSTRFIAEELTVETVRKYVIHALQNSSHGILRGLFPYLIDILSRTVSLRKLVDCIRQVNRHNPNPLLACLATCTGRDFLVAFLDQVPEKAMPTMLGTLVSSNIPIPILLTDQPKPCPKGQKVLTALREVIMAKKYCLFLSFNLTTSEISPPFSKQLYPILCANREDTMSISHPGSIDISFHSASENHIRQPVAIAEVYNSKTPSQFMNGVVNGLSQYAFFLIIHVSDDDFVGNEISQELENQIHMISTKRCANEKRKILVLYKDTQKMKDHRARDTLNKRKFLIERILKSRFGNDEISFKRLSASKGQQQLDELKADIFNAILRVKEQYLYPYLSFNVSTSLHDITQIVVWPHDMSGRYFAQCMQDAGFISGLSSFRRRQIFPASYVEHEIENLRDKKHLTTCEDNRNFISEAELCQKIKKFESTKLAIGDTSPLSILSLFVEGIKENDIFKMRAFARNVDDFFKAHLHELSMLDQSEDSARQHIKQQIEDNDISIHDFWREFVILANITVTREISVSQKLYSVDIKTLENAYRTWVIEGEAMQMLDGLSLRALDTDFLTKVLTSIMTDPNRQLLVISVIGLESSGKSTLLNYLFKCGFSTAAGRCTKGMYMSYRHSMFNGQPIDLLILDSEGMGSTAQKYITRRTSFDKKITLLALMCSQIVIINTKGLTRDIANILEVSSYHLDALKASRLKPRLHFVLRDMMDKAEVQKPAFLDIRTSLEEMFRQIPGCTEDLDDFMTVEQKDVHLLVNAFSSFNDDFRPRVDIISETENIHETFPIKVSNLRKDLLASALDSTHVQETKMFDNVNGFIVQMKTTWGMIDARGSFLHFNDFKEIQKWNAMQAIVQMLQKNLKPFREEVNECIKVHIRKLEANYNQSDQIHNEFMAKLSSIEKKHRDKSLLEFDQQAANQFDARIKDEGRNLVHNMFATDKLSLEAKWCEEERKYNEKALINNAVKDFGDQIKINSAHDLEELRRDQNKRDRLFDDTWKKVKQSHEDFMEKIENSSQLEQLVNSFNEAIKGGQSTVDSRNPGFQQRFHRKFWMSLEMPAVLSTEGIVMNYDVIHTRIAIKAQGRTAQVLQTCRLADNTSVKNEAAQNVLKEVEKVTNAICTEIKVEKSLRIEYGKTHSWLQRLCDGLFNVIGNLSNPQARYSPEISDFNPIEKYLRLEVYKTLSQNLKEWRSEQKKKLEALKEELQSSFNNLLLDHSANNLSLELTKHILGKVTESLSTHESTIKDDVENYLQASWVNKFGATHWAHKRSFGNRDHNAVREYLTDLDKFARKIFNEESNPRINTLVNDKIKEIKKKIKDIEAILIAEITNVWSLGAKSNIKAMVEKSRGKAAYNYVERFSSVFGEYIVEDPRKFCVIFKKQLKKKFVELHDIWETEEHLDTTKRRIQCRANETIEAKWDTLEGCTARCPCCAAKCEDIKGTNHTHHTSTHVMTAFGGCRTEHTREVTLYICSEQAAHDTRWKYYTTGGKYVELNTLMTLNQPPWQIIVPKPSTDIEISNMRAVWWKLKDEWCKKYGMVDVTPADWVKYAK